MEIINAVPEYAITTVISFAIVYGMKYVEKLIHAKVLHAKTAQSKELWSFIEQVSTVAVNSLVSAQMTGDEKFTKATAIVQDSLNRQGFKNVDVKAIEAAVQSAYEKSSLTSQTSQVRYDFGTPTMSDTTTVDEKTVKNDVNDTQPVIN